MKIKIIDFEGPYSCPTPYTKSPCTLYKDSVCYASSCYPYASYYPCSTAASTAAAAITAAAINSDLAVRRTLTRKNAEILDLSLKYKKELADLENQLNHTKMENDGLKGLSNDLKAEADVLKAELVFFCLIH